MASTYSTNLAIELIGTGDQAGSWGNTTNTNLGTLIEQAISGYVTQAMTTGNTTTITIPNGATGVARNMFIEMTGTGGTNTVLQVPANKKLYFIYNNTTGAVTVKVSGQTGVSVAAAAKVILVSNGTDVVNATTYGTGNGTVTSVTASSPISSSGGNTPNISLGTVGTANGGSGLTATPTNGQLLIGNGSGYTLANITAGTNITVTNSAGGITIASTGVSTGKSIAMAMIFGF